MIAIIQGCGANIASVQMALTRIGKESILTDDANIIKSASHVILPGVGTAHQAMAQLQQLKLVEIIRSLTQPVLGICLGMQLLYEFSQEGDVDCLGILPGNITLLPAKPGFTLPHMGWNQLLINQKDSPLLQGIADGSNVYFVHSYSAPVNHNTLVHTDYSQAFSAIVQNKNFYGMQFHPERSGAIGELLLKNFINLPPLKKGVAEREARRGDFS